MKLKLDYRSIKFKTWLYFILFTTFLMIILWFLQVLFLNNFYEVMKTEQTNNIVKNIEQTYENSGSEKFLESIENISDTNDMYIYISSFDGSTMYFKPSGDTTSSRYYSKQIEIVNQRLLDTQLDSVSLRIKGLDDSKEVLAYGSVLIDKNKTPLIVYIFSPLWPVSSTIQILTNQLIYVTFISLMLACCISFYLSVRITRPIRNIANSAERLAGGEYGVVFKGGHYTEIDNLADTLTRASIQLEKSDMLQKDLIANVSHDLRTPLTMIKSYACMIQEISGDNPEKRAKHTQVIIDESDRLTSLVNDILNLSKIRSGMDSLKITNFNLSEFVHTVCERFGYLSETQGYTIERDIEDELYTEADMEKIEQVVYNLIGNAVNYTGEDKKIKVGLKKEKDGVLRFTVTDTGKGIPPDQIDTIWDRYYRSSETHKRPIKGTGLGLSIVKTILQKHNFLFGVESEVGKGSTFYVLFPEK